MINIAVIGTGPWGKNHVRVYNEIDTANLKYVCDLNKDSLNKLKLKDYTKKTSDYKEVVNDPNVDGVSICVPASFHYKITKEFLCAGKNVLVEKPLCLSSKEAKDLIKIAENNKLHLMVGHIFRFNPAILKIKEIIKTGELGKIYFISLSRLGLTKPREDCGAILNYAVHDFDILCDILDKKLATEITANTTNCLNREFEDIAIISLKYGDVLGLIEASWLTPKKRRDLWIIGEKKSAYIDTINFEIQIYDSGIIPQYNSLGEFQHITHEGDIHKISTDNKEPLKSELEHFIECIKNDNIPLTNGYVGLRSILMAEIALKSAKEKRTIIVENNDKTIQDLR